MFGGWNAQCRRSFSQSSATASDALAEVPAPSPPHHTRATPSVVRRNHFNPRQPASCLSTPARSTKVRALMPAFNDQRCVAGTMEARLPDLHSALKQRVAAFSKSPRGRFQNARPIGSQDSVPASHPSGRNYGGFILQIRSRSPESSCWSHQHEMHKKRDRPLVRSLVNLFANLSEAPKPYGARRRKCRSAPPAGAT